MRRALVVLFALTIGVPLAATIAGVDGGDAAAENRDLTKFPQWDRTWKSTRDFPDGFTRWFEDHFAFRAALVRWYGESRLFGFGVSPSSVVVKGRDGWLFYGDDGGTVDYANEPPLTPGELGAWREALVLARNWLHGRGIAYVFTIAPDKHVIYPEHMPPTIRPVRSVSRTDQIYHALEGTGVAVSDPRPALLRAKSLERVYFQTDTHWNDRGALVAYQDLIETIRKQTPAVPPPWTRADFQATEERIRGKDLAGMLGLRWVLHETEFRLIPIRPRLARVVEPPGDEPMSEVGHLVTEIPGSTLPRAVVFRDSFASRLVPFLSEHFSRAVYLWQNDFDANVVKTEHPDVVIQQIVGRHLYEFIASPELVPH